MGPLLSSPERLDECKHNSQHQAAGIISLIPPLAAGLGAWLGAWLGARCDGDLLGECQPSCHGPAGQQPHDNQAQGRGPSYILSTNMMKYRGCESCLISFGLSLPV